MRLLVSASIIGASVMPMAANGQHPLILERLKSWNDAAPVPAPELVNAEALKIGLAVQKAIGGCVPTSVSVESVVPASGVRFVFEGILYRQLKNAWTITVRHPNCGNEVMRYALVRRADDSLYGFRINQGRSNANESLIGDTMPMAMLAASSAINEQGQKCEETSAKLGVTRIAGEEADLGPEMYGIRYKGSWSEVWPVIMCGRTAEVTVRFTADGDGGAYHNIKADLVTVLPAAR